MLKMLMEYRYTYGDFDLSHKGNWNRIVCRQEACTGGTGKNGQSYRTTE